MHADAQLHAVFLLVLDHCPGHNGAFAGELDRIADQVGQDLLEPQRVAHQRQGRVAVHQAYQFELLGMRGGGEDGQGVLQQVAQVERHAVEHQFAGFNLREIEDFVDDAQQVIRRFFDSAQVIELARRQFAFLQQVSKTEDAVERCADLMAHVGQELRLDTAGFQGFLACQVQLDVLDLDGFQVLAHVFGGLVDAVLQLFLGILQGFGHAVDARRELVQFLAAQGWQACFQVAVLELRHRLLDLANRRIDGTADTQGEGGGAHQADGDQQKAGEQAAIAAQQHAIVGQLDFHPTQQAVGLIGNQLARQVAMAAKHRQ